MNNNQYTSAFIVFLVSYLIFSSVSFATDTSYTSYTIDTIYFNTQNHLEISTASIYQTLLHFKSGDPFNYSRIRKSMENLYKVGIFDNVEIRILPKANQKLDIQFLLMPKYRLHSIKIAGNIPTFKVFEVSDSFSRKDLRKAIFAMRENTNFEVEQLAEVKKEVTNFLNGHGYFQPQVRYDVYKNRAHRTVTVKIFVTTGPQAKIRQINVSSTPESFTAKIKTYFKSGAYVPNRMAREIENVKLFLKKEKYYFPEVTCTEKFLDPNKTQVNLDINVVSGYRYKFNFVGISERFDLIATIWEKNVFEIWAKNEADARILYYLKNKGYLNAEVSSTITEDEATNQKTITFNVKKKKKYRLGEIFLQGNHAVSNAELFKIIKTNTILFNKYFYLRLQSLLVDREILRLYYYYLGYTQAQVQVQPEFEKADQYEIPGLPKSQQGAAKLNITFVINEGKRYTVESILFEGNQFFNDQALLSYLRLREKSPFVEQRLNEDIDKIKNLYHLYGYDQIEITSEISQGTEKSILIKIKEGKPFVMGDLVVVGISYFQQSLIRSLFPLSKNQPFNPVRVDSFEREMENSGIFTEFKVIKIPKDNRVFDILIKATGDYSRFYGFGVGWEGRGYFRGTLEYQGQNVFNTYSTLSTMVQVGTNERRGILSYDTPYFLKTHLNSSIKLWADTEVYPSYQFNRFGIGGTLIKKLAVDSYMMASLSWYRTELTHLEITPSGIDKPGAYFDTTALNLSYVRERRDDPFNPNKGSFLSADLKIGFPIFEKDYSFAKFQFSYQKNLKLLKSGVLTVSVRNGLATRGLSITERFFAGGVNSFRGRRRDRLGPIDIATGKPTGGNGMVLFNIEATFPIGILPTPDFYYTIFADIGNVFDQVKSIDFTGLEKALGFGLKYKTRMGPVRFDLGWDVNQPFTFKSFKFHIGIGNLF